MFKSSSRLIHNSSQSVYLVAMLEISCETLCQIDHINVWFLNNFTGEFNGTNIMLKATQSAMTKARNTRFILMPRTFQYLLTAILITALNATCFGQFPWLPLNGPNGGGVDHIVTVGNTVFVTERTRIYRSSEQGNTWKDIGLVRSCDRITAFATVGERLYIACSDAIYVSTDLGGTWRQLDETFDRISAMVVIDSTLYASSYYDLQMSTDFGESWTSIKDYAPTSHPFHLTHSGSHLFLIHNGHYMSADQGQTWKQLDDSTKRRFNTFLLDGNNLLGGSEQGLHISTDLGTSWTRIGNELQSENVVQLAQFFNHLYAVTDRGVFKSVTNGTTWENVLQSVRISASSRIVNLGNRLLLSHNKYGIYASEDNGESWAQSNSGIVATTVRDLLLYQNKLFAACDINGLSFSNNFRHTWNDIASFKDIGVKCLADAGKSIAVGTTSGWYYSIDSGQTFTKHQDAHTSQTTIHAIAYQNGLLAMVVGQRLCVLYKTEDDGVTWKFLNSTTLPSVPTIHTTYNIENQITIESGVVYAITDGGLSISENEGKSWRTVDAYMLRSDLPHAFTGVGAHGSTVVAAAWGAVQYRSLDFGKTWTVLSRLEDTDIRRFVRYGNGFIAVSSTIRYIADSSTRWIDISDGMTTESFSTVVVTNGYMYACGIRSGVWRRMLSSTSNVGSTLLFPPYSSAISLWPTPAVGFVTLRLPEVTPSRQATITFYSSIGSKVFEQTADRLLEGDHSLTINTLELPNGWYTAVVTVGNQTFAAPCLVQH